MTTEFDELAQRLAVLEDRQAIIDLLERHMQSLDYADEDTYVDCYTVDGVFETHNLVTGTVSAVRGHGEIRHKIIGHTRPPELFHQHLVGHPIIRLDGDTASSQSYFLLNVGMADGRPATIMFGRNVDDLTRGEDGKWRIANRRAEVGGYDPVWMDLRDIRRNMLQSGAISE